MSNPSYDAIVVGARCAGAATALLLGRAGLRVLLVDRSTLPSDIPQGHLIHRHGVSRLSRWGLLEPILADCPPIDAWVTDLGDGPVVAEGVRIGDVPSAVGPRRFSFDEILLKAAIASGVEFRDRWTLEDVVRDGDRVVGVQGRAHGGALSVERSALAIGADGRRSRLARLVGAEPREFVAPITCWYFSYWSGIKAVGLELYHRGESALFCFPTNDGLFAIFGVWPAASLDEVRRDPGRALDDLIARVPSLADRTASARRVERVFGAIDLPNVRRQAAGPGWALVGDAGCHKDPFLALGMCDALRDAELLAGSVVGAAATGSSLDAALTQYSDAHDAATSEDFVENMRRAKLAPPSPAVLRLRAALRENPLQARAFHLAIEGMIEPAQFFNVDNLRDLVGDEVPVAFLATFAATEVGRVKRAGVGSFPVQGGALPNAGPGLFAV